MLASPDLADLGLLIELPTALRRTGSRSAIHSFRLAPVMGRARKRQQATSGREPAPPSPNSSVRVGARDDAPLSPPAPLSETMGQHVERMLKDPELVQLASTVAAILRATRWNTSRLEDPNNEGRLVADLEKPYLFFINHERLQEKLIDAHCSVQSIVDVHDAARMIAAALMTSAQSTRTLCVCVVGASSALCAQAPSVDPTIA